MTNQVDLDIMTVNTRIEVVDRSTAAWCVLQLDSESQTHETVGANVLKNALRLDWDVST